MNDLYADFDTQRRRVDVDNLDVTVREIVRMVNSGEIDRAAEYQRQFRWDEGRESRLVESILLGLPVPSVFVAANRDGTWELVDGLQRLSSLVHFVTEEPCRDGFKMVGKARPLVLEGLAALPSFNGLEYSTLPEPIRLQLLKRSIRVTVISDKSDRQVRFDVFQRLNTGGIQLSDHEIRACVYRGSMMDFVEKAAADASIRNLIKLQAGKKSDGTMEEFVLKIFAYCEFRSEFDGSVKSFLNDYCEKMSAAFDYSKAKMLLDGAVESLSSVFSGPILKARYAVTPLNLAEAIFVAAIELRREGYCLFSPLDGWLADADLMRFTTKGTNTRAALEGRIARAKALLKGSDPIIEE